MSTKTTIEWTDATWNPLRGCSRISEGCRNCYAERQAARFSQPGQPFAGIAKMGAAGPQWTGRVELVESLLAEPLRWKTPRKIFVNSMSDLFHEGVQNDWLEAIFTVMALAHWHTFQILTKRPARMAVWCSDGDQVLGGCRFAQRFPQLIEKRWKHAFARAIPPGRTWTWPLPNVWLGVSVENQDTADQRIPSLLATPAAIRWVSYEPALGPVDFSKYLDLCNFSIALDWVVAGGESGPHARMCEPDWFRSVRDQCRDAGVPFFFKQWGAWSQGNIREWGNNKRRAGRLLDGREHSEFPKVPS